MFKLFLEGVTMGPGSSFLYKNQKNLGKAKKCFRDSWLDVPLFKVLLECVFV